MNNLTWLICLCITLWATFVWPCPQLAYWFCRITGLGAFVKHDGKWLWEDEITYEWEDND